MPCSTPPDATAPNRVFREVFDVGPGAGASVFVITPDDRFVILPVSGIQSPGDAVYNRDYQGEHSRRLIAQLTPFGLPGTHSVGDDRVCMAWVSPTGGIVLDTAFKDELTGQPCVAMDRPTSYEWPNHGKTGAAKPHGMSFINMDDLGEKRGEARR